MDRLAMALAVICGALPAYAADPYDPQAGTMNTPESVSETQARPAINENARPAAITCTLPDGTTAAYDKDGYMVVPRR